MIVDRHLPRRYRLPGTPREFVFACAELARRRVRTLAPGAADRFLSCGHGTGTPLARGLGRVLRAGALEPLVRRLGASGEPARRELGALLEAALAAGDDSTALKLAATAARGPDRRVEKIVSHRYRFVWICNPKAASRSLIAALRTADPDAVLVRHRTLEQVYARYPEARPYFRFAFLRHPFERVRSFYADKHALARRDRAAYRWFIKPYPGVRLGMAFAELCRWLDSPCGADAFADRHWLSQWRQVADDQGRLPDFLGRCERIEADWRAVSALLGLPATSLPRLNAGDVGLLRASAPDPEIDALLRRRYARDYRIGGYGATS
ncbi:MAG: sulfotransferase family protein [Acidobacteria bacterium]|nr:sulfotransferase family protein [Acidobacteriota bacterium]MYF66493.1 sulfotransferase family protein [Gammaproteobacteria bacterium]MYI75260.1 sulfotransferase family protein [Acidobacteriota bacterium]